MLVLVATISVVVAVSAVIGLALALFGRWM